MLTELFTHLADPQDDQFASCRAAVRRVYRRCGTGGGGTSGIIRDSESRLAEGITGRALEKHDEHTLQLSILLHRVAVTPLDQPLAEEENLRLRAIAEHVSLTESEFVVTMRRMQQNIDAILGESEPKERGKVRKRAISTHKSEIQRMVIAEQLLRSAYEDVGRVLPEPPPTELVLRVRKDAAAGIELEAMLLEKAAFDGANMGSRPNRNLRWDQRIAFNIGQTIGRWTLWLVTNDGAFKKAAIATKYGDRVHTLDEYELWLGEE